jgi:hypothetical protein
LKNLAKEEDVIKENTDQTYDFVDEFLEEVMKTLKQMKMLIVNIGHQPILFMQHIA